FDKAVLIALASCLVDSALQDPRLKGFAEGLNDETRAWLYRHLNELVGSLATRGVKVKATTAGRPSVSEDTILIPSKLLTAIRSGEQAAEEEDYQKWRRIDDAMVAGGV